MRGKWMLSYLIILGVLFYFAHASSCVAAALRLGALRAAASRPCINTSCFGLELITVVIPVKTGIQCQQVQCMQLSVDTVNAESLHLNA